MEFKHAKGYSWQRYKPVLKQLVVASLGKFITIGECGGCIGWRCGLHEGVGQDFPALKGGLVAGPKKDLFGGQLKSKKDNS